MGSETARAPLGMLMSERPEKVTFCRVDACTWWIPAVPFTGNATVTAVIGRFVRPKAFEILRRICEAPTVMWRVCLIVALTKTVPV